MRIADYIDHLNGVIGRKNIEIAKLEAELQQMRAAIPKAEPIRTKRQEAAYRSHPYRTHFWLGEGAELTWINKDKRARMLNPNLKYGTELPRGVRTEPWFCTGWRARQVADYLGKKAFVMNLGRTVAWIE